MLVSDFGVPTSRLVLGLTGGKGFELFTDLRDHAPPQLSVFESRHSS
jgi:hypothetical protein